MNEEDIVAFMHKCWASDGSFKRTDNDLYPDWNPSSVIDNAICSSRNLAREALVGRYRYTELTQYLEPVIA